MARISLDEAAIRRFVNGPELQRVMKRVGNDILDDAQANIVHMGVVDTGAMYRSGFVDQEGTDVRVGFTVDYAKYVNEGTRPHIIRAKPGGVLAFPGAGGTVFATEVHHPGTEPAPFLTQAALKKRVIT